MKLKRIRILGDHYKYRFTLCYGTTVPSVCL